MGATNIGPAKRVATPPDVLVIGGGPAGCAAATLLARWGHDVVILSRPASHRAPLPESIPPSTAKLFDLLGVADAINGAGFVRSTGNTVCWGREEIRVEQFASAARGWQVTASTLEPLLQAAAVRAGAQIEHGRLTAEQAITRGAAFILDCTGRAGVLARARRLRESDSQQRIVALVGFWHPRTHFDLPDPTHTVIESYANGWAWSVPHQAGGRYVAVMVDPRRSDLAHEATARDVYAAEIQKTDFLKERLQGAELIERPTGWDASAYFAARYADDNVLLVGDAASFIDPLSSAGVKKALASGWLAAVVVHTSLVRPAMQHLALDFYCAREREVYAAFDAMTRRYLAEASAGYAHPFWNDRTPDVGGESHEIGEAAIAAAFESIRRADSVHLRRAPDVRIQQSPAVSGCEIVLESRIVCGAYPTGVRYCHDVDLIALLDLAPAYDQVPDLFAAYNRRSAPVALPEFLAALATAVSRGFLRLEAGPACPERRDVTGAEGIAPVRRR